jgi:transcription-repair coupling factor (superfamily II helicase)
MATYVSGRLVLTGVAQAVRTSAEQHARTANNHPGYAGTARIVVAPEWRTGIIVLMQLASLLPALQRDRAFQEVVVDLGTQQARPLLSVITSARPVALAALHAVLNEPLLVITARPGDARTLVAELSAWVEDRAAVSLFPETDALPYDNLPNDADKLADRLAVLQRLAGVVKNGSPPLIVASVRAAMDLLEDPAVFRDRHQPVERGQATPMTQLVEQWLQLGYEPSPLVDQPGLFSRRGGIVDVFPPGGRPLRIEFWGDVVDTIRVFDAATQRSTEQLERATIGPAHEVLPRQLVASLDLEHVRPQLRSGFERDRRFLHEGRQAFASLEFYRGLLGSATLPDYMPASGVLAVEEPTAVAAVAREFEEQVEQLHTDLLDRGEVPRGLVRPYRAWSEVLRRLHPGTRRLDVGLNPDAPGLPFVHAAKFGGRLDAFLDAVEQPRPPVRSVIVSQQSDRLAELIGERGALRARVQESGLRAQSSDPETKRQHVEGGLIPDTRAPSPRGEAELGPITLLHGLMREGWVAPELDLALYTDSEIFGWTKQRRSAPARSGSSQHAAQEARDKFIADLAPGELVVHIDHGIARYGGLVQSAIGITPEAGFMPEHSPGRAEFLILEYAEGDRLYVPVSQADRVGRYIGSGDAQPSLTRLGSGEWIRAKAKVRRSVRDLAHELMDLYSARAAIDGHPYPDDTTWQAELEGSFAFEETPDQVAAIHDVKADMESTRPMDRLLVGDVGFGKTEIALRAAFKAVQDGRQVALLVPTTVLAQQHFNTFRDRLGPFPVRVEMLSRFRSDREQRAIVDSLASGSVDIVIGTHRLIQKDVQFKNLGLAIIDEEQRFGVTHKERLKQLRREVDVLTLTATPIPRTLHMGLVGVRDMSVLETPPEARLPVRTYVQEYDEGLVGEAILREIDRGGQVYYVHNRVQGIDRIAARLRRLVPEARIAVAHGQMPEDQLEQTMLDFAEGEHDVLVCTTIIESGLDIPNANTLIVHNAERFGLAQLYQLRGRVGRSAVRAYAYFMHGQDLVLSEVATERLRTIFEATELGAGLRIAMKDLEIRGAGNLLGAAQSGHIAAIGFDLYTKLLAEQVELLRARRSPTGPLNLLGGVQTSLDLPLSAFIPPEYVADDPVRLRLYQRFAALTSDDELAGLVAEIEDRFGPLPEAAQNLVYATSLRRRASAAGVEEIAAVDGEIVVKFDRLPALDRERLVQAVGAPLKRGSNQLRLERGQGSVWMGRLYALLEALPDGR